MTGGSWSLRDPAPKIAIKEQVCVQHWTSGVDGGLPTVRVTLLDTQQRTRRTSSRSLGQTDGHRTITVT